MNFKEWWDDRNAKPVDIGFDCAQAAWEFQEKRLAESQAREKALRNAMNDYFKQYPHMMKGYVLDAISIPAHDTALKSMLSKERERYITVGNMLRNAYIEHGIPENELVFCVATVTDYQNAIHALGNKNESI